MESSKNKDGEAFKSTEERVVFETLVEYSPLNDTTLSGLSCDLSSGGIYLRTAYPLSLNETISLSFILPWQDEECAITCDARIAWTNLDKGRPKPDYSAGVGLQFLDISRGDAERLKEFVEAYDQHKKMNVVCAWCGSFLGMRKGPFGRTSHGICHRCRVLLEEDAALFSKPKEPL